MYRAFNVHIIDQEMDTLLKNSNQVYDDFLLISHSHKQYIQQSLDNFLLPNNSIDVQSLEQDWFPSVDAHVFISHSHKDIELVQKFEKWLYQQFGIKCFVDSKVWGYANDLLKKLDDKYSLLYSENNINTYYYEKTIISSSHVHMMLATALLKMIDKINYIFFLNTPQSLSLNNIHQFTYSPWIYYELLLLKFIRKNKIKRLTEQEMRQSFSMEAENLAMSFPVDIKNLCKLSRDNLYAWENHMMSHENTPYSALEQLDLLFPDVKLTDNFSKRGRIYG
ncbi:MULTISPECIES: toll/interleukin-1 receptor domain-containing protein [Treponema]|uniref:TIR domain-containing protein n=1 Tax=Treponema denticola (strain ATCC 35405 / DSM 14222 / CIP 103919 / JCM 8153 / KCTC 15104) TaxID=243275 RepID=Q73M91_TREDE|nr:MULTISPECIES: toll/interleukin-1 receptor domain-containing protein [Treponema]AAS12135.1 conserved hypothetical protein [Treponema denticola ATCC 35405]EMB37837.1 hypothetical protein HMPREF9735_01431 [Treponema denticola ATCC 33521]EMB40309.1 hypothetical protein HMPREF9721_00403 [Treponema denticola ATCC 35404]UYT09019.1 toll/interleukin-1 receptor domain-containing protein [Treponema denticola]HCY94943.1 hypothetical protein [Treponema sp.]